MQQSSDEIPANIYISVGIVNQFIALFYEISPSEPALSNPGKTLRRLLRKATKVSGNYYLSDRWIFEIKDDILENIFVAPKLSHHSKQRLSERFNVSKPEMFLMVALAIVNGRILSQKERRGLHIGKHTTAVRFEDCIYILRERTLLTVFQLE